MIAEVDSQLRPLHAGPPVDGDIVRVAGVTVAISDRCPIAFPTAPTATGTAPPVVTITGENSLAIDSVRVEITTGGNRGTAVFKYSFDGGLTWSETGVTTAATYEMKLHGMPTGLTLNFCHGQRIHERQRLRVDQTEVHEHPAEARLALALVLDEAADRVCASRSPTRS